MRLFSVEPPHQHQPLNLQISFLSVPLCLREIISSTGERTNRGEEVCECVRNCRPEVRRRSHSRQSNKPPLVVENLRTETAVYRFGGQCPASLEAFVVNALSSGNSGAALASLQGTACCCPACQVVWGPRSAMAAATRFSQRGPCAITFSVNCGGNCLATCDSLSGRVTLSQWRYVDVNQWITRIKPSGDRSSAQH
jgi:hypothetical protein